MIADIITFAQCHPFAYGIAIGGMGFGGSLGVIGWFLGYDHAMRKVGGWMQTKKPQADEAHGDVPTLPVAGRERRFIPTVGRS